jgi:hypothetical protein
MVRKTSITCNIDSGGRRWRKLPRRWRISSRLGQVLASHRQERAGCPTPGLRSGEVFSDANPVR